jgi:hypothetical protein
VKSQPKQTFLVEVLQQRNQLFPDVEERLVQKLAVGRQYPDRAKLFDDETPVVTGRRDHRERVGQPYGHLFQLYIQGRGHLRHRCAGSYGRQRDPGSLQHISSLICLWCGEGFHHV